MISRTCERRLRFTTCSALLLLPALAGAGTPAAAPVPCTTFRLAVGDQILFGRNYDWSLGTGFLTVNKRGLSKTALSSPGTPDEPARWVSRFGSVTFNQYGAELPAGGINEAGLVVESMWLASTRYPAPDKRPGVHVATWIQYQLDTARTVDEVVASHTKLRILPGLVPLHFLVCDKTGATATIEFLDGKQVVHRGDELPYAALANTAYEKSVSRLEQCQEFGGAKPMGKSKKSVDRFCRAARGIDSYSGKPGKAAVEHAFSILSDVSQGASTKWSIVYDIANMRIYFKTAKSPEVKHLALKSCDFSARTPRAQLDINTAKPGDVAARFSDYSRERNRSQVYAAFKTTNQPFAKVPDAILDLIAGYPSTIEPATAKPLVGAKSGK